MEENMPLGEFITLPDTIAFTSSYNDYFRNYIQDKPYIRTGTVLSDTQIISYINEDRFEDLVEDFGTNIVSMVPSVMGLLDRASQEAAGVIQVQQQPYLNLRGNGVLLGFVDTGIDYTNDAFKYEDGTSKIKYIWDQTIKESPPQGFFFGTEYTNEQIDKALKSSNPREVVPHEDTVGHGTFLASIARREEKQ